MIRWTISSWSRDGNWGLPDGTIHLKFNGSAGQSLGAFCPNGMTLELEGDANDYIGKGMCGAKLIVYPPKNSHEALVADQNIIVGNVAFYGATAGEAFIAGVAGERFCVRNSGVHTVIEGIGDHGAEYMTGGSITCLGGTGRNFGAGMSGGVAYIFNEHGDFESKLNRAMVNLYPMIECRDVEIAELKGRIERHVELTGSVKGQAILDDWNASLEKFLKVMPADYERVLNALERARESGLEGDEAILAAFEENAKVGN